MVGEKTNGTIWKEDLVSKSWRRRYQLNSETKDSKTDNFVHSQELRVLDNPERLSVGDSTLCLRILKYTDTWEVVRDRRCVRRREKRLDSESESE